jgi:hypothetical protein
MITKRMKNNILKQVENGIKNQLECVVIEKAIAIIKSCTFSLGKIPNVVEDTLTMYRIIIEF